MALTRVCARTAARAFVRAATPQSLGSPCQSSAAALNRSNYRCRRVRQAVMRRRHSF